MSNFFNEFDHVSKEEWSSKIQADLRGKNASLLQTSDAIEELDYSCFYHSEDQISPGNPGSFPFKRGPLKIKNDWSNGAVIEVDDASAANKHALSLLMMGADLIWFKSMRSGIEWSTVLEGIQMDHIHTQFTPYTIADLDSIKKCIGTASQVQFNFDAIALNLEGTIMDLTQSMKDSGKSYLLVNGYGVQQSGATTWQDVC